MAVRTKRPTWERESSCQSLQSTQVCVANLVQSGRKVLGRSSVNEKLENDENVAKGAMPPRTALASLRYKVHDRVHGTAGSMQTARVTS